jgi:hypothetical protein
MLMRIRCLGCWVALAGLLLLTACGSTLPSAEQARLNANATGRGTAGTGAAAGFDETVPGGSGDAGASGAGSPGVAAGGTRSTRTTGGSTGAGAAATAGGETAAGAPGSGEGASALGPSAPGVSDTEIKIGLVYDVNQGATNAALGVAPAVGQIDTRRAYDALIAEVNRTGGVAGRKLKPVYFTFDSLAGKTTDTIYEEACAAFTQDDRVFGVLVSGTDSFRQCLTKARVAQVAAGVGLSDSQTFQQFPYLVETLAPALDRMVAFQVPALKQAGYYAEGRDGPLPAGMKLGVMMYDEPVFHRALKVLRAGLAAEGIEIADAVAIKSAESTDQIGDEVAAIRAASLKFKEQGITHVQFLATNNAFLQWRFMQDSEKQLYQPRYGLSSNDGGQALATLLGNDAGPQLTSSVSVGWFPLFDVPARDYSGENELPALQRCKKILQDAGETFGEGDPTRNKEAQASIFCDAFFYFQAAVTDGGPQVTPESWLAGVAQQDGLASAATFVMKTTAERRDGMGAYRDAKFFEDCTCFHYTSDLYLV